MATDSDPIIGNWYMHYDKGEKFQVVAVDPEARSVVLQYYGGDVDELDFFTWYQLPVEPIEAPEDEMAPMDPMEPDDLDYSEISEPDDWDAAAEGDKKPKDRWNEMTGTFEPDEGEDWDGDYNGSENR